MPRPIASATISFGLVTVPVNLYPATESRADVHFHWVHAKCGNRVKQQYYCPTDDEVVPRKDLVKGYEIGRGRSVTFTPQELEKLDAEATQTIDIEEFLPIEKVDPIFFAHAYHLAPGKGGARPFAILGKAMGDSGRAALGRYAARGKEYLVLLRPLENGLVLQQLHYADEVRPPVAEPAGKTKPAELALAKQLIDKISVDRFSPDKYHDTVRERVRAQIKRKAEGEEITTPKPQQPRKVVDLMEALRASLGEGRGRKQAARRPPRRARAGGRAKRRKSSAA